MYGRKYVWVMPLALLSWNWYKDQLTPQDDTNCTVEEILTAAEGHLVISKTNLRKDGVVTVANKTADHIWDMIKQRKREINPTRNFTENSRLYYPDATFAYDALWAISSTLHEATNSPHFMNFTDFDHKHENAKMLSRILQNIYMEGVSGTLAYDSITRERISEATLKQWRNGTYVEIGYTQGRKIHFLKDELEKTFPNGVPRDRGIIKYEAKTYNLDLLIGIWLLIFLGIVLAFIVLAFNIKYKDVEVIKMSSPTVNNLICIGCILCYCSVILHGMDSRIVDKQYLSILCNCTWIVLGVGFTLSFGGLFSKTWKAYQIFTIDKRSLEPVVIKDIHLTLVVLALVVIDVIVFGGWMLTNPFELNERELEPTEDVVNDILYVPIIYQCKCKHQFYFTLAVYIYKGLLVLFGIFLAWETRNITVNALNDSKYIGMAVYNTFILSVIGAVSTHALNNITNYDASYVVVAISVCLSTTVTLLLIFLPKVYMLYTNPESWSSYKQENSGKNRSIVHTQLSEFDHPTGCSPVPKNDIEIHDDTKTNDEKCSVYNDSLEVEITSEKNYDPALVYCGPAVDSR